MTEAELSDPHASWPFLALFSYVDTTGEIQDSSVSAVAHDLDLHPETGLVADDARRLLAQMTVCEPEAAARQSATDSNPTFATARELTARWYRTLDSLDSDHENVQSAIRQAVRCLQPAVPTGPPIEDLADWLGELERWRRNVDPTDAAGVDEVMSGNLEFDRIYADCIEPVVDARAAVRSEARRRFIDDNLSLLTDLQRDIPDVSDG